MSATKPPTRLFVFSGKYLVYGYLERYSFLPYFARFADQLRTAFPNGVELYDVKAHVTQPRAGDKLLCLDPNPEDRPQLEEVVQLFDPADATLALYENPAAFSYRKWILDATLLDLFGTVYSSAALLADGVRFRWIPLWNFVTNFEDGSLVGAPRETVPEGRRCLAINPMLTGIEASRDRLNIIDYFIKHTSDRAIFGLKELFQEPPLDKWIDAYGGEIPYSPKPYRFREKEEIFSRFKFVLVIENSFCDGYITEKLAEPLMALTVPIYFGPPHIERFLPSLFSGGALNGHAFPSLDALVHAMTHMTESEYQSRLDTVRKFRAEYFALTSRAAISDWILSSLFPVLPSIEIARLQNHNRLIAEQNCAEEREVRRREILRLASSDADNDTYDRLARRLLFEPNEMPFADRKEYP